MKTTREVIQDMRNHYEEMKGSPAKGILKAWVELLEESLSVEPAQNTPQTAPEPRHGTFDVKETGNREIWEFGQRGSVIPHYRCYTKPFGYYPDLNQS
jgi:hypothetical protein